MRIETASPSTADSVAAAPLGRRVAALALDCVIAVLVAGAFSYPDPPKIWSSLALFFSYTFFTGLFVQTPGMRLVGVACVRFRDGAPLGVPRAALRALLLQIVLPALVMDDYGRGWHDRKAGSIMIRVKASA